MSGDYLSPAGCPLARPALEQMSATTRELHAALDRNAPYLHPEARTVQLDLGGSPAVVAWQEAKAAHLMEGDGAWSELPQLYARYGTRGTGELIARIRELEAARCALVVDSGMQAVAIAADVLLAPGDHAVVLRQVYNKSKAYLTRVTQGQVSVVDDGDLAALEAAIRPETRLVFAETYTNPLMRAQDVPALVALCRRHPRVKLVIDDTIATPWGPRIPLLTQGVHVVVASATKALCGQDTLLGGILATNDADVGNAAMDLLAMRGGIMDDERARQLAAGLALAEARHARRCASASRVAAFLHGHPRVSQVFHPSLPDHPDAAVIARDYQRPGSIVSFRVAGADEDATRRFCDALASTVVPRYALSFDGLATKVNHHRTVSEYFTPREALERAGFDRLVRLGVGLEEAGDVIACLNWALHHGLQVTSRPSR